MSERHIKNSLQKSSGRSPIGVERNPSVSSGQVSEADSGIFGKGSKSLSLDELATQMLPERIIRAIGEIQLIVVIAEGDIVVETDTRARARIPIKKALAILISLTGLLWTATHFEVFRYLSVLLVLLNGGQPGL